MMGNMKKLFIVTLLINLIATDISTYLYGELFLAPPGAGSFKSDAHFFRDFTKLTEEGARMTIGELFSSQEYMHGMRMIIDFDSIPITAPVINIYGFEIKLSDTIEDLLIRENIPIYIKKKIHDAVIDVFIESFYTGVNVDQYHRYDEEQEAFKELAFIRDFFKDVLEFEKPLDILYQLLKPAAREHTKQINVLETGGQKSIFEAHSSENCGINICDSCKDKGSAIVHELMALSGFADHAFNEEVEIAYRRWRKDKNTEDSFVKYVKDEIKKRLEEQERKRDIIEQEFLDITNIYDPRIFPVKGKRKYKNNKFRKFLSVEEIKDTMSEIFGNNIYMDYSTALPDTIVKKLAEVVPRFVATCNSKNPDLGDSSIFWLNNIMKNCPQIEPNYIFRAFQVQGVEILYDVQDNLRKAYLKRWSSSKQKFNKLLRFNLKDKEAIEMEIMLKETAIFTRRALFNEKSGASKLAGIAYRKAYKLFQEYIRRYARINRNRLLAESEKSNVVNFFELNIYDPEKKEINIIQHMFVDIMNNLKLFKTIGIELTPLEEAYALFCVANEEIAIIGRAIVEIEDDLLRPIPIDGKCDAELASEKEKLKAQKKEARKKAEKYSRAFSMRLLMVSFEKRDFAKLNDPGSLIRRYHYAENLYNQSL